VRTATVSALCLSLSLISFPRPAAGQSNSPSPSLTAWQIAPALRKLPDLQKDTENKGLPVGTNSTHEPGNAPQSWMNLLAQQDKPSTEQFHAGLKERLKEEILPQLESHRCAHILIFQAPKLDSKMVVEAPPSSGDNITTFKGLRPCCRDLRGLHGLPPTAPKAPVPNLEGWLNHLRP